jgi:hypothetical protein
MKSPFLQEMTASEPLTLEEEYEMQTSWHEDEESTSMILVYHFLDSPIFFFFFFFFFFCRAYVYYHQFAKWF